MKNRFAVFPNLSQESRRVNLACPLDQLHADENRCDEKIDGLLDDRLELVDPSQHEGVEDEPHDEEDDRNPAFVLVIEGFRVLNHVTRLSDGS